MTSAVNFTQVAVPILLNSTTVELVADKVREISNAVTAKLASKY